jgi:undecaprenyl diphosphate synthase
VPRTRVTEHAVHAIPRHAWRRRDNETVVARESKVPAHVAVIMDGNGRWAARHGRPRRDGHAVGSKVELATCKALSDAGIACVSVFGFSTENWSRPPAEVSFLMNQRRDYLVANAPTFMASNIRLRRVGRRAGVPPDVLEAFDQVEALTKENSGLQYNICFNYGGRTELEDAAAAGRIADHLYTGVFQDVDLLIRTSGERRLSNFMLWQCAFAELYFVETLWPDFTSAELTRALEWYASRSRRFGALPDGT